MQNIHLATQHTSTVKYTNKQESVLQRSKIHWLESIILQKKQPIVYVIKSFSEIYKACKT